MNDTRSETSARLPVSVFIIACNEADRITKCITSVQNWVAEVVVIDSGSTDETVSVVKSLGARVLFREWRGYGSQKVFGESQCGNNWILNIDADEEISDGLRTEIAALFQGGEPPCIAYRLPILPVYPFQTQGHPWTISNRPVRLYNQRYAGFRDHPVHDSVTVRTGSIGTLKESVLHRSFRSLSHHVDKVNRYSSAQAETLFQSDRRPTLWGLLLLPPLAFLKSYLLRREFVNGIDGIVISYMYAFQRFIRIAKARERFQQEERE
ncbi:MAG: glycosyltransferase family 2 protein [Gammaproteobacteria bacterium]